MTTLEATKIKASNFEATTNDGKKIFMPKHWLESFGQFVKRKHKKEIAELMKRVEMTQKRLSEEENDV